LGAYGRGSNDIFAAAVLESSVYLIATGAFEGGPAQVLRRSTTQVSPSRTARTTVRRVGLDGRPTPAAASGRASDDVTSEAVA
jgi:hypothetical protein